MTSDSSLLQSSFRLLRFQKHTAEAAVLSPWTRHCILNVPFSISWKLMAGGKSTTNLHPFKADQKIFIVFLAAKCY